MQEATTRNKFNAMRSSSSSLMAFLTLLLAVAIALLGLLRQWPSLLEVSKAVVACSACLKVHAACRETVLIRSLLRQLESHWVGKRAPLRPLLGNVYHAIIGLGASWAVALALISMAPVMHLPAMIPKTGMLYALIIVVTGMELLNSNLIHTRLAFASDRQASQ